MTKKYTEGEFAGQVEDLLERFGWLWCHFRPARTMRGWRTAVTGHKGFPDYVAVRPPRLIFAELKSEKGEVSPEQTEWIDTLRKCETKTPKMFRGQPEVYLWRPSQIEEIAGILK